MTTWTDDMKESVSKQWLNPFVVLDYKNEIVGIYRNSKQCERESESEFGFSLLESVKHSSKFTKVIKDSDLKKLVLNSIKNIGEE